MKAFPRALAALFMAGTIGAHGGPVRASADQDPARSYLDWLDLVAYHIQPVEKDVFLKLTDDRDRDVFIMTFWKQRDPTPGTPENEFRDELKKRFRYCNEWLGRNTTRPGWQTDQGRIYMILGPPQGIERFEATIGVVPCMSWTYYGDARQNLPPQFVLLFYQRGGVGEWKLYDPVSDGPARLLLNQRDIGDPFDYQDLVEKISELSPTLAEAAITRIPGERNPDWSPSPRNAILLADIVASAKKDVNPSYATHFLDYKGMVSTEYLTNYVDAESVVALVADPVTGLRFCHFSMVPVDVAVDYYAPKSQYYCNFQINVSLRCGEAVVFQYSRDFPLDFPEDSWERVKANGLSVEDSFPVADGQYKLSILMTNTVGKQFSLLERDLTVPPPKSGPAIDGPFLGYRFETYPRDLHIPFKVLDKKLVVDPKKTFAASDGIGVLFNVLNVTDSLAKGGEARLTVRGLRPQNPVRKTFAVRLDAPRTGRTLSVPYLIPAGMLEPDYYDVVVTLAGPGGEVLDEKRESMSVSPAAVLGHPIANAKGTPLANQFLFHFMVAEQAERTNQPAAARAHYENAYRMRPDDKDGIVRYGAFLVRSGAFEEALKVAEGLRGDDKRRFMFHVIRGQALLGLEKFEEALRDLDQANRIYDSETGVLNALGRCYSKLGRKTDALRAYHASLRLNPDQPEVKRLAAELDKAPARIDFPGGLG